MILTFILTCEILLSSPKPLPPPEICSTCEVEYETAELKDSPTEDRIVVCIECYWYRDLKRQGSLKEIRDIGLKHIEDWHTENHRGHLFLVRNHKVKGAKK